MREAGRVASGAPPHPAPRISHPADVRTLQALLDLSGPGGYVLLLGSAAQHAVGLAGLMGGIHFVGVNAPDDVEELPVRSEEHTSELQSQSNLVCRLLLEKKKKKTLHHA